jgi:hypothetical protein
MATRKIKKDKPQDNPGPRKMLAMRVPMMTWNKLHQIAFELGEKEKRQFSFTAVVVRLIEDRYALINRGTTK